MDDYLIDRETLGKFVDELIKKEPLAVNDVEELDSLREKTMKALDDKISTDLFGKLNDEQLSEINKLLDESEDPDIFQSFFDRAGIDMEQSITDSMQDFAKSFLGGQNE
ncbi:hypothetical protein IKG33_02590 [Candidatus Saccharibacteria bacterium]|nr:hypothetical protein [Candidatus Saccharibacteria bacterium]